MQGALGRINIANYSKFNYNSKCNLNIQSQKRTLYLNGSIAAN